MPTTVNYTENYNLAIIPAESNQVTFGNWRNLMAGTASNMTKIDAALSSKSETAILTGTIGTTWVGSSAPFTQDVTVTGLLSTDNPIIDIVQTGTWATDVIMRTAWNKVARAVASAADTLTIYAEIAIDSSIPIQLKVVR